MAIDPDDSSLIGILHAKMHDLALVCYYQA